MRTELELVIIAIMLLVGALVILTMFGGGMGQLGQITNAQNVCRQNFELSCRTTGQLPSTWSTAVVFTENGVGKTCANIVNCNCGSDGQGNYKATCS